MCESMPLAYDAKNYRYDAGNSYFHVALSPLTKAQVAPYRGYEIVDYQRHDLDPDTIYHVYRPPEELAKPETVQSVTGIPITLEHEFIDPEHKPKQQVGMTGDKAEWRAPFLMNSLHITNADAIRRIEDGSMRQLSLAYTYEPDWRSGTTADGEHYDLIMRHIRANHVALVEEGRAGPDVYVFDDNSNVTNTNKVTKSMEDKSQALLQIVQILQTAVEAMQKLASSDATAEPAPEPTTAPTAPATDEEPKPDDAMTDDDSTGEDKPACDEEPKGDDVTTDKDDTGEEKAASDGEPEPVDSDKAAADEGDDDVTEDDDDEDIAALMAAMGLEGASEAEKECFLKGRESVKKEQAAAAAAASDSAKRLRAKTKVKAKGKAADHTVTASTVRQFKPVRGTSLESRMAAADHVKPTTGALRAYSFDSASAIYLHALKTLGIKGDKNMPANMLRQCYDVAASSAKTRRPTFKAADSAPLDSAAAQFANALTTNYVGI